VLLILQSLTFLVLINHLEAMNSERVWAQYSRLTLETKHTRLSAIKKNLYCKLQIANLKFIQPCQSQGLIDRGGAALCQMLTTCITKILQVFCKLVKQDLVWSLLVPGKSFCVEGI